MQTTVFYFLQVVFCAAIMMGYYWLVLRNKQFHQYNRFYLLMVAGLSWLVPLIKIQLNGTHFSDGTNIYYLLSAVADNNTEIEINLQKHWYQLSWQTWLQYVYILVALCLLFSFFISIWRIYQMYRLNVAKSFGEIVLILTNAKGTPYSFFKLIFWNEAIDLNSTTGQQILHHELTHVREKHSFDKIYMQLILIAGWFNPFFWLIKKELHMIHEFIADQKSVDAGDTASLAKMLLTAAYPQHQYQLTNPFFFSPIKRRIAMLTKQHHSRFSYLRRLIVLPLLAIIVVLVAFRSAATTQPISVESVINKIYNNFSGVPSNTVIPKSVDLEQEYTVVINAGHGGYDKGAIGIDGETNESKLTLALANAIKSLNQNSQINLVFTRETDAYQSVVDIAAIANQAKPDLFVALHYNASPNPQLSGSEIFVANKTKTKHYNSHYQFANQIANHLDDLQMPFNGIKSRAEGIFVLQNVNCPSVIVEAGYLSNQADFEKIKQAAFTQQMAIAILNGIQQYLAAKEKGLIDETFKAISQSSTDKSISFAAQKDTGIAKADSATSMPLDKAYFDFQNKININYAKALFLVDGKIMDKSEVSMIHPSKIKSFEVINAKTALEIFGEDGKNGVVKVTLFNANVPAHRVGMSLKEIIIEPKFKGGATAWAKFLQDNLNRNLPIDKGAPPGKYTAILSFMVDAKGKLSNIKAENNPGYGIAKESVRVMKLSPNWIPASKQGKPIVYKHKQTITFMITED